MDDGNRYACLFLFCIAGQLCIIITQLCSGLSAFNLRPKQDEPCFCSFILQAPVQRSTQGTSQQSAKPWPIAHTHTHQPQTARQTHLQWSCCFGYAVFGPPPETAKAAMLSCLFQTAKRLSCSPRAVGIFRTERTRSAQISSDQQPA